MKKFNPIKTLKVTCKECGHEGTLEVDEKTANTPIVNYVAKIRFDARNAALDEACEHLNTAAGLAQSRAVANALRGQISLLQALKSKEPS